ncbi:MAG: SAM-dependent chlorinase/fluorinase [Anaerolineae bacterium]|nr:SAM-dependent chlorinase/fluorinase [Anaerolineae bacterium]
MNTHCTATITLITDFGLQDGHVGAMKGVMHGIAPQACLVDISHHIPPQDIQHGGFVLMTAFPFWPPTTIHLIVVDPGVGTERRAVAVRTAHGTFVAPDNGVLSYALGRGPALEVVSLTNPAYWRQPVSPVFHGRDIFGPAAAHLAAGVPLSALGHALPPEDLVRMDVPTPIRHPDGSITAHVQHIDTFGNCTTNVPGDWVRAREFWQISVAGRTIERIDYTFGDVATGQLVALVDSTDFVAIAVRNGSAANTLGLAIGSLLTLSHRDAETGQAQ